MQNENIPTIKEKNIFWAGIQLNAVVSLIGALFISSFFYIITRYSDYGFLNMLLLFLNSGIGLFVMILYASKKISRVTE